MEEILKSIADSLQRIADHFDPIGAESRELIKAVKNGTASLPEIDETEDIWG